MTHQFPLRVYYEDTDLGGIVYHANYLKFIERARSTWVRELGVDQNAMKAEGIIFAVARVEADFRKPARFDDALEVETEIASISAARLVFAQTVRRGPETMFEARVTVVIVDEAGRPKRLPEALRETLERVR